MLKTPGKRATEPTTHDSTHYGISRASPKSFVAHHMAAISAAIVRADAVAVMPAAAAMSFKLSVGVVP